MRVYAIKIQDITDIDEQKLMDVLDSDRKRQIKKLKCNEDRLRSICAGLLLHYVFLTEGHQEEEWKQVIHKKNEYGKPYFDNYPYFHFSISHSGDWVVCGVHDQEIGVDIQRKKCGSGKIAQRFFSEKENAWLLQKQSPDERRTLFYKMWTAKESYVKLAGTSIAKGITQYIYDDENKHIFDERNRRYACIDFIEIESDYILGICYRKTDSEVKLITVSAKDCWRSLC